MRGLGGAWAYWFHSSAETDACMGDSRGHWSERSEALADALARVALGDRAAFATVYRASGAHLFGVILRIDADRAQAEDILQDVFVNIWRAAQGFDAARSQPMTWLTGIARNRAIDSLRRRKTEPATVSANVPGDDGDDDRDRRSAIGLRRNADGAHGHAVHAGGTAGVRPGARGPCRGPRNRRTGRRDADRPAC